MDRDENNVTVILPCAGMGKRLGLGDPKELFEIFPGRRLIDYSLEHIMEEMERRRDEKCRGRVRLAVVVRPHKRRVVHYVQKKLPRMTVHPVFFNERFRDWPGSVHSAQRYYSERNIVLLPDSFLALSKKNPYRSHGNETLLQQLSALLNRSDVAFGFVSSRDSECLKNLGAMRVNSQGCVVDFQDKPKGGLSKYNGFWGCYGFRKERGEDLYRFLIGSVRHKQLPFMKQSFYPPWSIRLQRYYDIGTWENVNSFRRGST